MIQNVSANPKDKESLQKLAAIANDSRGWYRTYVVGSLKQLGYIYKKHPESHSTFDATLLPAIKSYLDDPECYTRREAALSAKEFRSIAKLAIPELLQAMKKHPNEDSAWFAADALGNLGTDGQAANPALEEAISSTIPDGQELAKHAAKTLAKIRETPEDEGVGRLNSCNRNFQLKSHQLPLKFAPL